MQPQKLINEMADLKHRVVMLEKVMTMLMEIEEVTPEKLTKRERNHLERTSRYLREGRTDKFMSLEEFQQKIGL